MSITFSARAGVAAGVVALGLIAPAAVSATAAAPTKPSSGVRYTAQVLGPRAQSNGYSFGTDTRGIANNGDVLVTSSSAAPVVVTGTKVRELPSADSLSEWPATPSQIAPDGSVYGANVSGFFKWSKDSVEVRQVAKADGNPVRFGAVNEAGTVAGCVYHYRVSTPAYGSFTKNSITELSWPGEYGNCEVTDMSSAGVATLNQTGPYYRNDGVWPKAAVLTGKGVNYLVTPTSVGSSADAISPNGKYIVGRLQKDGKNTVAWLSTTRTPVRLRNADGITPIDVTNQGLIVGVKDGRLVSWKNGAVADLTRTAKLPQGWVLTSASGINPRGQIAATATVGDTGETVAVRLTPRGGR